MNCHSQIELLRSRPTMNGALSVFVLKLNQTPYVVIRSPSTLTRYTDKLKFV